MSIRKTKKDEPRDRGSTCQMEKCDRSATGDFTRRMYSSASGESWPEDVSERPICWYHHVLLESVKAGVAATLFALVVGVLAWFTGANDMFYLYATMALLAGLLLSEVVRRVRKG